MESKQLALPIDKLCCKLAGRPREGSYSPVVLVSCGSFNPPTNMHLRMFDLAQHTLLQVRQAGVRVPDNPTTKCHRGLRSLSGMRRWG